MKRILPLVLLICICLSAPRLICAESSETERLEAITRVTAYLIGHQHYRHQALDDGVSSQIFDEYFRNLDPNKMFFTMEDIRAFEPQRMALSKQLVAGKASFAFDVYKRFLERLREYKMFTEELLKKPIDFSANETYEPDRRKLPWPSSEEALHQLWKKKLKNDLLYFRLAKRSSDARKGDDGQDQKREASKQNAAHAFWDRQTPEEKVAKRLRDMYNSYQQREKIDILGLYLTSVALVYGPHSAYMAPQDDEHFEIGMSLSLSGIGATLTSDGGYVRVVSIVPGGPAALDGRLHPGDRIIAVAQENGEPVDVIDMSVDHAVRLIRGAAGSKVTLTVLSDGKGRNAVPESIVITRAKVELKDGAAQGDVQEITRSDGGKLKIGIVDLPSFYMDFAAASKGDPNYKSCSRDVKAILERFKKEHVDAVVMDLRGNSGGSLPEAIAMTGLFIETGPVVQVRHGNGSLQVECDRDSSVAWTGPLVVLTNKFSASASEIFTGAIKDYKRGLIAGDSRTFGKGTVITVSPLNQILNLANQRFPAGALQLETAMFFRINGDSVQQLGVEPDVVLPSLTEEMEVGEMFSNNHLPWDSVRPRSCQTWDAELPTLAESLKMKSKSRIAASAEYQKLITRIQLFKKQLKQKEVTLNEEKRWQEYLKSKAVQDDEQNSGVEDELSDIGGVRRTPASKDPVLQEAINIAADYAINRKKNRQK